MIVSMTRRKFEETFQLKLNSLREYPKYFAGNVAFQAQVIKVFSETTGISMSMMDPGNMQIEYDDQFDMMNIKLSKLSKIYTIERVNGRVGILKKGRVVVTGEIKDIEELQHIAYILNKEALSHGKL